MKLEDVNISFQGVTFEKNNTMEELWGVVTFQTPHVEYIEVPMESVEMLCRYSSHVADALPDGRVAVATNQAKQFEGKLRLKVTDHQQVWVLAQKWLFSSFLNLYKL